MELKIEYLPIEQIKPYAGNAKLHPAEQVEQIKKSIQDFGFNDPLAIWNGEIVEGHGRYIAAQELGIDTVPVIRLDSLSDEQRKAYALVHNKLTMNSDFDVDLLQEELESIDLDLSDFGFDIDSVPDLVDGEGGGVSSDTGFNYKEQYGVIVMCDDEESQEGIYNRLTGEGYNCRVVAV